jgi:hypothetical protein
MPSFDGTQVFLDALATASSWDSLSVTVPFPPNDTSDPRVVNVQYDLKNAYVTEVNQHGMFPPTIRLVCEQIDVRYLPAEGETELFSSWNFAAQQGEGGDDFGAETVPSDAQYAIDFSPGTPGGEVQADNLGVNITRSGDSSILFIYIVNHNDSTFPALFEALASGTMLNEVTVAGKNGSFWKLSGVQLRSTTLAFDLGASNTFSFTATHATYTVPIRDDNGNIIDQHTLDWDTDQDTGTGDTDFDADVPPQIVGFNFIPDSPSKLAVQFSENVSGSLDPTDISVQNLDDVASAPFSPASVDSFDPNRNTAVFSFSGPLPNDNYEATLAADRVQDAGAQYLTSGSTYDFFMLAADGNRNRTVDINDFNILATNFGKAGKSFVEGNYDFSSDGRVSITDFNILAANFGKHLQQVIVFGNAPTASTSTNQFDTVSGSTETPLLSEAKGRIFSEQLLEDAALL